MWHYVSIFDLLFCYLTFLLRVLVFFLSILSYPNSTHQTTLPCHMTLEGEGYRAFFSFRTAAYARLKEHNTILKQSCPFIFIFIIPYLVLRHLWLVSVTVIDRRPRVCRPFLQFCSLELLSLDACDLNLRSSGDRVFSFLLCYPASL